MIEINLLPEERRKKKKESAIAKVDFSSLGIESLPVVKIAAAAFGVLLAIQATLFFTGAIGNYYLGRIDHRYGLILSQKNEADKLKSETAAINRKASAIDELMVNRFSWAKKLAELSDSMTPGIWLTELSYDEKVVERPVLQEAAANPVKGPPAAPARPATEKVLGRLLVLSGYASGMGEQGTALIGRFIKSLKDNADFYSAFSNIELGTIRRDKFDDQDVMNFRITCLFKDKR